MIRPQEIIAVKRDGRALAAEQIGEFVKGVSSGAWADYQISAMVMAMFIRGLDDAEQEALTREMLYSGEVMDLSDIEKPIADKHSTGGVGDKTSLIIAPLAAACGLAVPMISGRGLGHTGGTLDKLESIPGFNVNLSADEFKSVLKTCGFAMSGQTAEIAPADKKLYALRDATATVPYIPLIVASIMSKKLAEDLDALVLDVKTGSGAFMTAAEDSKRLAEAMVRTGNGFGVKTQAVVSYMGQPLGQFVGNAVEVYECIKLLRGEGNEAMQPTLDLSLELTARMLELGGAADSLDAARIMAADALMSGAALECFRRNVETQNGDTAVCDDPKRLLDLSLQEIPVKADRAGYVSAIDTAAVGDAVCGIGGGRIKAEDDVDHGVGMACEAKIGDEVSEGDVLGILYCRKSADADAQNLRLAYTISEEPPESAPLIREIIS